MISARLVKAALKHNVDLSELTHNGLVKRKPKPNKKHGKGLLPPDPKTRRPRLVEKGFSWEDMEKVLRGNSAHGFPHVEPERVILPVSGRDLRRRIHALGFTVTRFARRHGMAADMFYNMTHYPAGAILTRHIRLLEYEETLAAMADILEADLTLEQVRSRLEAILDDAATRL